ncbi:hypothetical protein [Intrasporangium sp.]|uniref:TadE/TadG family type IV pilus assembly protein n=1 Tax=Intrasporangium sp. TaxID=1925024 RepID=UPI00322222AD
MTGRIHRLLGERDRGSFAIQFAVLGLTLIVLAMFSYDQGNMIMAARAATTGAQEAARAAGQHLSAQAVTGANAPVDTAKAAAAARAYLRAADLAGTVTVTGQTIHITTSKAWTPTVFALFGATTATRAMTGQATARVLRQ